ncbi:MAG TPA: hydroxymethylbilane synthase [Candidatus Binatia bacterium]
MIGFRIGSRGSALALAQADWVKRKLEQTGLKVEIIVIKTSGDRFVDRTIQSLGGKGIFTKEIEDALLSGTIDLAVHSMKDLPTELPKGLAIAAVPQREDARDVLVSRENIPLKDLPKGAQLATGSLRRRSQILNYRSDLTMIPIRGNVDTRLQKLFDQGLDAIVLAAAGLKRLGRKERITEYLTPEICLSAVAQGALAIETRDDGPSRQSVAFLHHDPSFTEVTAERAFLRKLGGGCHVPVAARAFMEGELLNIMGMVAEPDGRRLCRDRIAGPKEQAAALGTELADRLIRAGAGEMLAGVVTGA